MAIEVRIPTILRTYTGGEKAVDAAGGTLSAVIDDLEGNHPGIKERLVDNGDRATRDFAHGAVDGSDYLMGKNLRRR